MAMRGRDRQAEHVMNKPDSETAPGYYTAWELREVATASTIFRRFAWVRSYIVGSRVMFEEVQQ
jgi:hypothetical protein